MSKALRFSLALLLVLLLALPALAAMMLLALAGTDNGTAFLARQLQQQLGEEISWQRLQGSLLGPLRLENVRVSQPGLDAEIRSLALDWQPTALLQGKLLVTELQADSIQVNLTETEPQETTEAFRPDDLQLPLDISLRNISLSKLQLQSAGEPVLSVDTLELDTELAGNALILHSLSVAMPEGAVSLLGRIQLSNSMPLALEAKWNVLLPPEEDAAAQGDAIALNGNAHVEGSLDWSDNIGFNLDYRLHARGLDAFDPQIPAALTAMGLLRGDQASDKVDIKRLTLALEETDLQLESSAEISALSGESPVVAATLAWQHLQWPLAATATLVSSETGKLTVTGNSAAFAVEMNAALTGQDIPPGNWQLSGSGDLQQLQISALRGQVLGGELRLSGPVSWQPYPSWQLELTGTDLDPAQLDPAVSGTLSLALDTHGSLRADSPIEAEVALHRLEGFLLNYPLQLTADASLIGESVELRQLLASSDGNQLSARGQLSAEDLMIDWTLAAPHPATFLPGASGVASASGTLTGSPNSPLLAAQFKAQQLQLDDLSVTSVTARVQAGLAAEDALELTIDAGAATAGETALFHTMQLRVAGSNAQHRLDLSADTGSEQLQLGLVGGLDTAALAWVGNLQSVDAVTADYGNWQLTAPASLQLAGEHISLTQACLGERSVGSTLCTTGNWNADGAMQLSASLNGLPLDMFLEQATGDISADVQGSVAANGALRANGTLQLSPGEVRIQLDQALQSLPFAGGDITLEINDKGLTARADLAAPEQGRLDASIALPALRTLPLVEQQPIIGRIQAVMPDIAGFAALVPEVASLAGSLNADLNLGGSVQRPAITGELSLQNGAANVPLAGLKLREIDLRALSKPTAAGQLVLSGGMRSGGGRLDLSGTASPLEGTLDMHILGDRFKLYDTPDARVWMSPDLALKWRDDMLSVRGQLTVPEAAITPRLELNPAAFSAAEDDTASTVQTIRTSPDVVVTNRKVQSPQDILETAAPFRIDSQIDFVLGDAVNVNAVGFISQITGAVRFTNTPEQAGVIPIADGRLTLSGGTFRSFGQDLEIENGQIIFAKVPATEPELNLRAVRWIDNDPQVTAAGVTVTGPLTQPVLELFSRPQLEASEIQSYLLTGRSPRSDDSVLSLGTYVSPRIYVGYGYNMVEKTSEFNSLFTVTPRYGLGANLGEADNNINVTFTLER